MMNSQAKASSYGILMFLLLIAEVVLILLSWILSAMRVDGVRSLLSGEGIRWFFGNFTSMVASPWLVWLLLLMIALGCLQKSGLYCLPRHSYRDRMALRITIVFFALYVGVILLLTAVPHSVLLSSTGSLFPSPFSRSITPVLSFGIILISVSFGMVSGRFQNLADVLDALSFGCRKGAPLFIFYILLIQLYESLRFVF
jgi:aminobenzoyl-glutamate transport protein